MAAAAAMDHEEEARVAEVDKGEFSQEEKNFPWDTCREISI
jgi:hypothetical protein